MSAEDEGKGLALVLRQFTTLFRRRDSLISEIDRLVYLLKKIALYCKNVGPRANQILPPPDMLRFAYYSRPESFGCT